MNRRETALALAELGYHVFPSRVIVKPDGTKVTQPYVAWSMASTTLPGMINSWWKRHPDAFPCIDCGKSGVVVVDCDVKHNAECEPSCPSGTVRWSDASSDSLPTRSGGTHHFYRADPDNPAGVDADGKLDRHVDVRGVGGMVIVHDVADISQLPKPVDLKPVPSVVFERVPSRASVKESIDSVKNNDLFELPARPFTREAALDFCRPAMSALRSARKGSINDRLNDAACQFSHFVPHIFKEEDVTRWLLNAQREAWVASGEEDDGDYTAALATIKSGLTQKQDPWSATEIASVSEPQSTTEADFKPQLSELDIAIVRERIRREARRIVDDEEASATASEDAIAQQREKFLTSDDLDSIQDLEPLIDGWLYKDSVARIVGESGSFKTFVALDMALSVASGKDAWFGYNLCSGPVVYVAAEGARGIRKRVRAWEFERNDGNRVTDLFIYPEPIQVLGKDWNAFTQACIGIGAVLVVLDTQARVTVGINENDNTDMGRVIDNAERLRQVTGACVTIVHHTGYDKSHARGASAVYAALQTELGITRETNDDEHMVLKLKAEKQKDSEELGPVSFKMVPVFESLVLSNVTSADERLSANEAVQRATRIAITEAMTLRIQVLEVLYGVASGGTGITFPELKRHLNDMRVTAGLPRFITSRDMKRGSKGISEAQLRKVVTSLQSEGKLERGATEARLYVSPDGAAEIGQGYVRQLGALDGDLE
jgi:hypothetical protein